MLKNEELLTQLTSEDDTQRNKAFRDIWESADFRRMAFGKSGLSQQEEDEVWHEAIIAFNKAFFGGTFKGEAKISTYLCSTVQNMLKSAYAKGKKVPTTELTERLADAREGALASQEDADTTNRDYDALLEQALRLSEERCQKLLKDWAHNLKPQTIAERHGLKDGDAAKKETYRCRQRLTRLIEQYPNLTLSSYSTHATKLQHNAN
jgi:RNA polymerase sigma factor (sigma-70 family)